MAYNPNAAESMVKMRTVPPHPAGWPSLLRQNLQCQPVRGVNTREEWHWSHAWQRFKRRSKGAKLNGILESANYVRKTRTVQQSQPNGANPNTAESMVENAHRTCCLVAKGWVADREGRAPYLLLGCEGEAG
jgi:hypothetical protein